MRADNAEAVQPDKQVTYLSFGERGDTKEAIHSYHIFGLRWPERSCSNEFVIRGALSQVAIIGVAIPPVTAGAGCLSHTYED